LQVQELDRAIAQFDLVIRKLPDFARAYHGRGQAFMADERYEFALEDFDKAIELEPEFPFSYLDRGKLYQIQGDMKAAIDDWNSVLETANSIRHESLIAEAEELLASADQ
jgi:tetratricopeptide (TPR) repeat protein